ncbi:MAG TPA: hypothetical protein VER08_01795 [Pyrinomonadaceae bacterium]|nr:hypothetical protein [Pyrinomonadaceae bacterium]
MNDDDARPADAMSEREIDENLDATFPASDPPSWTLGTDHAADPPDREPSETDPTRVSD